MFSRFIDLIRGKIRDFTYVYGREDLIDLVRNRGALVLSIDFFDTLVYREVLRPEDVFRLQYHTSIELLRYVANEAEWLSIRMGVERSLCERAYPGDTTLAAVYNGIAEQLGVSEDVKKLLLEHELACEKQVIAPYAEIVSAVNELCESGLKIIITTDTYLPPSFIKVICDGWFPLGYRLLCSSETNAPKRSGLAYKLIAEQANTARLIHVGDNLEADVRCAHRMGIEAHLARWKRYMLLSSDQDTGKYLQALGVIKVRTPYDEDSNLTEMHESYRYLGWQWAAVLADFLLEIRAYADEIDATDVWILSRDGESLFAALAECPQFFGARSVKYVMSSRASTYPVMASENPEVFERWTGYAPTNLDKERGKAAIAYYKDQLTPGSRRVLVVDVGWRGRIQVAIETALPQHVDVRGYYFALEPKAEAVSKANSRSFLAMDHALLHQVPVESLMGFSSPSCSHFEIDPAGEAQPIFKKNAWDRAPELYCAALRKYLISNLSHVIAPGAKNDRERLRRVITRRLCVFPGRYQAACFKLWTIGTGMYAEDDGQVISSERAPFVYRLLGLERGGNIWASGMVWTVSSNIHVVRTLQSLIWARKMIKGLFG